jgi:hypothetical protein
VFPIYCDSVANPARWEAHRKNHHRIRGRGALGGPYLIN